MCRRGEPATKYRPRENALDSTPLYCNVAVQWLRTCRHETHRVSFGSTARHINLPTLGAVQLFFDKNSIWYLVLLLIGHVYTVPGTTIQRARRMHLVSKCYGSIAEHVVCNGFVPLSRRVLITCNRATAVSRYIYSRPALLLHPNRCNQCRPIRCRHRWTHFFCSQLSYFLWR